jgi:hypothetical protein
MTKVMLGEITGLNPQGARARVRELGEALLLAAPNGGVRRPMLRGWRCNLAGPLIRLCRVHREG